MAPNDHPGRTSPDDFAERLKTLIAVHIAGSQQLLKRFSGFVSEASNAVSRSDPRDRVDAQALFARWLDFNLASYAVVTSSGLSLLNGLLSAAEESLLPRPPAMRADDTVELRLSGAPGDRAATGFMVENPFNQSVSVVLEATDLIPTSGPAVPASHVSFEPPKLVIPPHEHGIVQVAIAVTQAFAVGQTYRAAVRVVGLEAREVGLTLVVTPPVHRPPTDAPHAAPAPRRKRKTK
jgi:hypothetical protein